MRKGVLVAVGTAALLNTIVVALLFQAARVPSGTPVQTPTLKRHGIDRPFETRPSPSHPAPQTAMLAVLSIAVVAAGASLVALGVLTIVILQSGRRASVPVGQATASQPHPALQADWNPSVSRTNSETFLRPRREMPPTPQLVIPDSLGISQDATLLNDSAVPPSSSEKDRAWVALARECVDLYEEMDLTPGGSVPADHIRSRLLELLERSGVEVIENDTMFQRTRHQAKSASRMIADGTPIRQTVSPGFAVGSVVLRRADVHIGD